MCFLYFCWLPLHFRQHEKKEGAFCLIKNGLQKIAFQVVLEWVVLKFPPYMLRVLVLVLRLGVNTIFMSGSQFLEVMTNTIFDMEDEKNKKGGRRRSTQTRHHRGMLYIATRWWVNAMGQPVYSISDFCYSFYFPFRLPASLPI